MATLGRKRDDEQYSRLLGMAQPEATPTKRVGTEAPIGAMTTGPSAGKSAADFTKVSAASPGSVFQRQLGSADIGGVTRLAEQPLLREAGQESLRVAKEGQQYREAQAAERAKAPQFAKYDEELMGKIAGGGQEYETAEKILSAKPVETPELKIGEIKEFTPLQALRGGSVESLLRKEAQGPYSTGMAGLDALLFAKKGGAGQLQQRGQALQATEQAAADALEKAAPEEERRKAQELTETQKEQLKKAVQASLTGRQEKYTKAPEGGISKVTEKQRELYDTRQKQQQAAQTEFQNLINQQKQNLKSQLIYDRYFELHPEDRGQPFFFLTEQQMNNIQADPLLQYRLNQLNQQVTPAIERQDPFAYMEFSPVDIASFESVISPEDAAQYQKLQQLIDLPALQTKQLTSPTVKLSAQTRPKMNEFAQSLIEKYGLNK